MVDSLEYQDRRKRNAIKATLETGWNMSKGGLALCAVGLLATHGFHINPKDLGTDVIANTGSFIGGLAVGFIQSLILDLYTNKRLNHLLQQGEGTLVVNDEKTTSNKSIIMERCGDPRLEEKDGVKKAGSTFTLGALPFSILLSLGIASNFDGPAATFLEGHALGSNVLTAIKEHKAVMETTQKGIRLGQTQTPGELIDVHAQGHNLKCGKLGVTNPFTFTLKHFSDKPITYRLADAIAKPYEVMSFITTNLFYSPIVAIKNKGQATLTQIVGYSKINRKKHAH